MKRILTIQDISCFGKCSITIALPVISAMGVETAVLPTAVLSTHTMFTDYRKKDLTDTLLPFAEQWKDNGITFDAIYTGYLGTPDAAEAAVKVVEMLRRDDTLVFVDPVIGDHGKPYAGIGREYTACLDRLASMADHIVPNITEACLMTGSEYRAEYDQEYIDGLAREICSETGVKYTNILASESVSKAFEGVVAVPTTFILDKSGNLVCKPIVGADVEGYKKAVEDYLAGL